MSEINLPKETGPISCHAFNKDKSLVAIVPNSNIVFIYKNTGGQWVLENSLIQVFYIIVNYSMIN